MSTEEVRYYIRHPIDIPIAVRAVSHKSTEELQTQDLSTRGLCFTSSVSIAVGSHITIQIESVTPTFEAQCTVTWCQPKKDTFEIGVHFISQDEAYRARMVEQVCHIEQLRHQLAAEQNVHVSNISTEEAAKHWIENHAADFPDYLTLQP